MQNTVILMVAGVALGVLLASTFGSGIYQSGEFGMGSRKVVSVVRVFGTNGSLN